MALRLAGRLAAQQRRFLSSRLQLRLQPNATQWTRGLSTIGSQAAPPDVPSKSKGSEDAKQPVSRCVLCRVLAYSHLQCSTERQRTNR